MIPYMVGKLAPISSHLTGGWSNMFPLGVIFVPFPPKTGTNVLHPRPPPESLNWSSAIQGGKLSKRLRGNIGSKDKSSSWNLVEFPGSSSIESTVYSLRETHRYTALLRTVSINHKYWN